MPLDTHLADAGADVLSAMGALHAKVQATLAPKGKEKTSRKWVTAAKLCARKRPDLFPIRDNVIGRALSTRRYADHRVDYQVFRRLMQDTDIREGLSAAINKIRGEHPRIDVGSCELRILDVAHWTYGLQHRPI